jgi:transposase InsO family protein
VARRILHCVTMIDSATGWFEMKEIPNKEAMIIANIIEQTWFSRYPWPTQIIFDRGSEFMGEFTCMVQKDYGIPKKPITKRNPQANSILEWIHQTTGNMIHPTTVYNTTPHYQSLLNRSGTDTLS